MDRKRKSDHYDRRPPKQPRLSDEFLPKDPRDHRPSGGPPQMPPSLLSLDPRGGTCDPRVTPDSYTTAGAGGAAGYHHGDRDFLHSGDSNSRGEYPGGGGGSGGRQPSSSANSTPQGAYMQKH